MNSQKIRKKIILICGAVLLGLSPCFSSIEVSAKTHSHHMHIMRMHHSHHSHHSHHHHAHYSHHSHHSYKHMFKTGIVPVSSLHRMSPTKIMKMMSRPGGIRVKGHLTPKMRRSLTRKARKAGKTRMYNIKLSNYGLRQHKNKVHAMPYTTLVHHVSNHTLGKAHKAADMKALGKYLKARNLTGRQYTTLFRAMDRNKTWSVKGRNAMSNFYDHIIRLQIRHYTYQAINAYRHKFGKGSVHIAKNMQKIAQVRAKQAATAYETQPAAATSEQRKGNDKYSDAWIHGLIKHQTFADDAKRMHISSETKDAVKHGNTLSVNHAENAGDIVPSKHVTASSNFKSDKHFQVALTPREMAYDEIRSMIYYDHASHNGHRKAILNGHFHFTGIGAYFTMAGHGPRKIIHGAIIQEYE